MIYYAIDGIRGCGKSTQVALLKGYFDRVVREPGGTVVGEKIREILMQDQLNDYAKTLLFAAARDQLIDSFKSDEKILSDRCWLSTYAYQGHLANDFVPRIMPSKIVVLDIPVKVSLARTFKQDQFQLDESKFEIARRRYLSSWLGIKVIDGTQSHIAVNEQIKEYFNVC